MIAAPLPVNETERLNALEEYNILDTLPEVEFDDITRIASHVCGMPISLVTLLDQNRQWFKSKYGLDVGETPREQAFCGYTILDAEQPFIVPDSSKDERFADNALVTGEPYVAFYGGIPLVNPQGFVLGALCVIDHKPNNLNAEQLKTLQSLGRQIVALLELKRTLNQLSEKQIELKRAYEDLEKFAYMASHDLKSPLGNIVSLAYLIDDIAGDTLPEDAKEYLELINTSAFQLSHIIDGILEYSKSSQLLVDKKEAIIIPGLIKEIVSLLSLPKGFKVTWQQEARKIFTSRIALTQVLLNLISNAIKYNDKEDGMVDITFTEAKGIFTFSVKDNGPGISEGEQSKMFDLFERLKQSNGKKEGAGIGLSVVKRLVGKIGGEISVVSTVGQGSTFIFTVAGNRAQPALTN